MEELYDRTGMILAGRYRITELLGAGSMGSVWVAEQLALRTQVVVKFREELLIGADGEESAARFLREARTLASVRHRNVVELFEVGTADTGEPYLIMEKLKGQTLGALLAARRTLPLAEAFALFSGIARGLEAVHAAGIVHRDVKPDNIFLVAPEDMARRDTCPRSRCGASPTSTSVSTSTPSRPPSTRCSPRRARWRASPSPTCSSRRRWMGRRRSTRTDRTTPAR